MIPTSAMLLAASALPLLAGLLTALLPRRWDARAGWPLSVALSVALVVALLLPAEPLALECTWLNLSSLPPLTFALEWSPATAPLTRTVLIVSLAVSLFSMRYLHSDPEQRRYFGVLGGFVSAMLGVAISANLFTLLVGWELVGLASFFLIGHWHTQPAVGRAARLAILANRIGDAALLAALAMGVSGAAAAYAEWVAVLMLVAAAAKSAQGPQLLWLPDAMVGPTPVSALVHSATMVAAGIVLLVKVMPWLGAVALDVALGLGVVTALAGGLWALRQTDLKRILAYSTVSQLGVMLAGIGLGNAAAAEAHLLSHALFKATLFLTAGVIIHRVERAAHESGEGLDPQDLRQLGGLARSLPLTTAAFVVAAASLVGLPLTSGGLSKEGILAAATAQPHHVVAVSLLLLTSVFTAAYTVWMGLALFAGRSRLPLAAQPLVNERDLGLLLPTLALAALTLWGSLAWRDAHLDWRLLVLSTLAAGAGAGLALRALPALRRGEFRPLQAPALPPELLHRAYRWALVRPTRWLARGLTALDELLIDPLVEALAWVWAVPVAAIIDWIDRRLVDALVHSTAQAFGAGGAALRRLQTGQVQTYLLLSLAALALALIALRALFA